MHNRGIACFLVVLLTAGGSFIAAKEKNADNAVCVNGIWIKRVQVEQVSDALKQQAMQMRPGIALNVTGADFRKGAVAQLIANELLLGEARKKGISFNDAQIGKSFEAFKAQIGEERFTQELKAVGRTENDIRRQLRDSMILDSLVKEMLKRSDTVSVAECQAFYKNNDSLFAEPGKVCARQIMVAVPANAVEKDRAAALRKAQELHTQLKGGKNFAELARLKSDDPNAKNGGDLGWFKHGDLLAQIDSAAFALKVNEFSGIISSPAGFHIIQKTDQENGGVRSFKSVKDQIRATLEFQRRSVMIQAHVDELKKKAKIDFADTAYIPEEAGGK